MTKASLMRKFGVKLFDALIQYIAEQLDKTEQEIVDGIANKLLLSGDKERILDYDWMNESV